MLSLVKVTISLLLSLVKVTISLSPQGTRPTIASTTTVDLPPPNINISVKETWSRNGEDDDQRTSKFTTLLSPEDGENFVLTNLNLKFYSKPVMGFG